MKVFKRPQGGLLVHNIKIKNASPKTILIIEFLLNLIFSNSNELLIMGVGRGSLSPWIF